MSQSVLDLILRTKKQGTGEKDAQSGLQGLNSALGSTIGVTIGAAAAIGALTAAFKFSISEAAEAQVVQAQLGAVLQSTGGAAGMSADEINSLADRLSGLSGVEDDVIVKAEAVLLTFTKVGEDVFPGATEAALNMSAALGTDLQGAMIMVGKALNDPIQGVTALRRVGVSFTEDQMTMIQALMDSNQVLEAQKLILGELETEFGGAAEAMGDTFTGSVNKLKVAFGNLGEAIGAKMLPGLQASVEGFTALINVLAQLAAFDQDKWLEEQNAALIQTTGSYDEYLARRTEQLVQAGIITEAEAAVIRSKQEEIRAMREQTIVINGVTTSYGDLSLAQAYGLYETGRLDAAAFDLITTYNALTGNTNLYTESEYRAAQATAALASEEEEYKRMMEDTTPAIDEQAEALDEAAAAQEAYQQGMAALSGLISGKLGPEVDDYSVSQQDLSERMAEVNAEIEKMLAWGYSEAGSKIQGLREEYGTLADEYAANATEHRTATNNIIFDIARQQLALSGLSPELQLGALEELAKQLGLVDTATQSSTVAMQALVGATTEDNANNLGDAMAYIADASLDGVVNAEELKRALDILNGTLVVVTYQYDTIGSPGGGNPNLDNPIPQAEGGDFIVNRPTLFLAGEAGPERATFTPIGDAGPGGATFYIVQNFYGAANPGQVRQATSNGVLEAARRIGAR